MQAGDINSHIIVYFKTHQLVRIKAKNTNCSQSIGKRKNPITEIFFYEGVCL